MVYIKPALEGKSRIRKRRPPALLIDGQQTAHYDDEAVCEAWPPRSEEIPVHRTFIDFGRMTRTPPDSPLLTVSTAPAVMCFSVKGALDAWKVKSSESIHCDTMCAITAGPPRSTGSSTRVPELTMLHESEQGAVELPESVTSTKASGFWQSTPCSTPRSLSESSQPTDPSALLNTELCKETVAGQMSATGVEAPYQEHAPPLLPFNAYYRGNFASCRLFEGGASELFGSAFPAAVRTPVEKTSGEVAKATLQKQLAKDCAEIANEARESTPADDESSDDDGSSSDDDLGLCPAYSESVPLPSIGSAAHSEGTCKRCCFFPKGRCNNGYDCQFCHFAHEKRKSKMKKKKKRRKKRQSAGSSVAVKNSQPQQAHPNAPSVHQLFGSSAHWTPCQPPQPSQTAIAEFLPSQHPAQRPSQLIVQGLQYVPATINVPVLQAVPWW